MSTINHEAAKERAEMYVKLSEDNVILNEFDVNLSRAYLDLAAQLEAANANADELQTRLDTVTASHCDMLRELEAAHAKIDKYQKRLEITHCYDGQTGERQEIPPEKRDTYPDGIECRDSTIHMLKKELKAERHRVDKLAELVEIAFHDQRCGNDAAWQQSIAHKKLSETMKGRDNG